MSKLIEGEDYIFDRYAFLEVAQDADIDAIKAALRQRKAKNHPDVYVRASAEAAATAKKIWDHTEDCEKILLDPKRREYFDIRLIWFREHYPDLISTSGVEIIGLNKPHIDLDLLVTGETPDTTRRMEFLQERSGVETFTQEILAAHYEKNPGDDKVRRAYAIALTKELAHLAGLEEIAWQTAGVTGFRIDTSQMANFNDYSDVVTQHIEKFAAEQIPEIVTGRALALDAGIAPPIAMLADPGNPDAPSALATLDESAQQWVIDQAVHTFKSRTHTITELAARKQEVLIKLLDLCPTYELTDEPHNTGETKIYVMNDNFPDGEPTAMFSVLIDNNYSMHELDLSELGTPLSALQSATFQHDTLAIVRNPNIEEMFIHVSHVMNKHRNPAPAQEANLER